MRDGTGLVAFGFMWGFMIGCGLIYTAARYGLVGGLVAVQ